MIFERVGGAPGFICTKCGIWMHMRDAEHHVCLVSQEVDNDKEVDEVNVASSDID